MAASVNGAKQKRQEADEEAKAEKPRERKNVTKKKSEISHARIYTHKQNSEKYAFVSNKHEQHSESVNE